MKSCKHKTGLTLVEMLIVIAIIAILAVMVISVATRIENRAKEQLTESTIALLNAALTQFNDYGYQYKYSDYSEFKFPLDCNGFPFDGAPPPLSDIKTTLENALGAVTVAIVGGVHDLSYSGSEVLYFFLSQVPESRQTLDKIDKALITNKDKNGIAMKITITISGTDTVYLLYRIIDPWGTPLRYDYYDESEPNIDDKIKTKRAFPVITSAGSDRKFGTNDDIKSR